MSPSSWRPDVAWSPACGCSCGCDGCPGTRCGSASTRARSAPPARSCTPAGTGAGLTRGRGARFDLHTNFTLPVGPRQVPARKFRGITWSKGKSKGTNIYHHSFNSVAPKLSEEDPVESEAGLRPTPAVAPVSVLGIPRGLELQHRVAPRQAGSLQPHQ